MQSGNYNQTQWSVVNYLLRNVVDTYQTFNFHALYVAGFQLGTRFVPTPWMPLNATRIFTESLQVENK